MPATATANGKAPSDSATAFVADTLKATNEQMITAVKQASSMSREAATAIFGSLAQMPPALPRLPAMAFMPTKATVTRMVNVSFDTAESLLSMQRKLTIRVVDRFVPSAGAR